MIDLSSLLNIINYGFVLFFGITVSLCLADISFHEHRKLYVLAYLGFGIGQFIFYLLLGEDRLYRCYPLLIHLPLILLIYFRLKRNLSVAMIAVLSAYLMCTPRKWLGTLVSSLFHYDPTVANLTTILATLPLLFVVIRYAAPHIIKLKHESKTILSLFLLLPLCYYILEYAFTVYTDLLYSGGAVIIEFMDSFIVLLYLILSILTIEFSSQKNQAERENLILTTAAMQAQKEIAQLSEADRQSAIYRHDLRHHIHFIQECIRENEPEQALQYMEHICDSLDRIPVKKYCENNALNLILSSYIGKAAEQNIPTEVSVTTTDFSRFQVPDLCSLLSNALENAIYACSRIDAADSRYIHLKIYEKNHQLCINMANSYQDEPVFENDIPVSNRTGHGLGVQSIISVIEKYHGIYGFFASGGEFRFQASL